MNMNIWWQLNIKPESDFFTGLTLMKYRGQQTAFIRKTERPNRYAQKVWEDLGWCGLLNPYRVTLNDREIDITEIGSFQDFVRAKFYFKPSPGAMKYIKHFKKVRAKIDQDIENKKRKSLKNGINKPKALKDKR